MLQQRLDLRAAPGGSLEHLTSGVSRSAGQCESGSQSPIGPSLVGTEKERLVPNHRSAHGAPKLILDAVWGIGATCRLVEIAPRVHAVVVVEPERGAVKVIRAT